MVETTREKQSHVFLHYDYSHCSLTVDLPPSSGTSSVIDPQSMAVIMKVLNTARRLCCLMHFKYSISQEIRFHRTLLNFTCDESVLKKYSMKW